MNIVKQAVEGATSLAKPINDAQETGWEGKGETEVDGHQDLVMKRVTHEPLLHANRHIRLVDKQVHSFYILPFFQNVHLFYIR